MPDNPMSDDRVREGVRHFSDQLRKLGLIGEMPSTVGEAREAQPDPVAILQDGLPPMIRTVPQPDRK